jgi:predicted DsbA family dithiol-disulfide isomerase
LTLEELFRGHNKDIGMMLARLQQVARQEDLPFGDRTHTYNSRLAQELGKYAEERENGDVFHDTAFKAYFVHGKNIAQIPVLVELAESIGLDGDEARDAIEARTYMDAVDEDWTLARSLGITAVPTFHLSGQNLVGAQPYEMLEQFLIQNSVKRKA